MIKQDVIILMEQLRQKGLSQAEIAVALGKNTQTIWSWGSKTQPNRMPDKANFEKLQELLG